MKKKYVVLVEGKNIYLNRGRVVRMGLFTTRCVESDSDDQASRKAIELVIEELNTATVLQNANDDPPVFFVDSLREVDGFDGIGNKGFSFFEEESDS